MSKLLAPLGLVAAGLLVWLVGPLVAVADYRPLESARARLAAIGLVAALCVGRMAWGLFKARRANARMMAGLLEQPEPPGPATPAPGTEEVALLRRRFEQALAVLKRARVGGAGGTLARMARPWVYELPWYVFIGAPGSGKTTALLNAGLRFPLAERFGQGPLAGVGGTRNCDWWFTDEAVLLDTAGRYATQDSEPPADSAAWNGFLQLLVQFRPRRPVNGVLLTLSATELLEPDPGRRAAHCAALRLRIEELHRRLAIRFPVYVLVTKTDLLAGFAEFFSEFGQDEREQVWGATLALDTSAPPRAAFQEELEALGRRIDAGLLDRLQRERDPQNRARLYVFPQQFAVLRHALDGFLEALFAPSAFTEAAQVRGVYFTSATQEGSPIDRVMAALGRALQLERQVLPPQRPAGKSFFLTRLLRDVVFREAGLACVNPRRERRRQLGQAAALAAALLLACGAIGAWSVSYLRNRAYVEEVDERRAMLAARLQPDPGSPASRTLPALLPLLDAARGLADMPGHDTPPLSMGFGLYQGDKLGAAARDAYSRLLRELLLPRLALRLEQQLRGEVRGTAGDPESLYALLKAYLMLHDPRHFDGAALKSFIAAGLEDDLARELEGESGEEPGAERRGALDQHLDALLARGDMAATAHQPDPRLVAEARAAVAATPLAERIYRRLARDGLGAGLPEFTIARAGGPSAALVFTRASGKPLSAGVPGLYSHDGYHTAFAAASERATAQLAGEEAWVLGNAGGPDAADPADPATRARLLEQVRRLYLQDYARVWEGYIGDIRLVRAGSLRQSVELARILSGPETPLPPLLRAIVREVTLRPAEAAGKTALEQAGETADSARRRLRQLFGRPSPPVAAAAPDRPEDIVDRRFEDLRRMVRADPPGTPPPVDAAIGLVKELYTLLTATEAALRGGTTPPPSEVPVKIRAEAGHLPEPVRSLLLNLAGAGATQTMGLTRAQLGRELRSAVFEFCRQAIAGRYPFTRNSQRDVTPEDFRRLFAAGGVLDDFFQKRLAPYVDTSARPWRLRDLGEAGLGAGDSPALVQFQRAQAIRAAFFPGTSQDAALRLEFKPLAMDAAISQFLLDVDGQPVKFSQGQAPAPVPVQWPGPRGGGQVRVQLTPPGAQAAGLLYEGPWALFRMFDQLRIDGGAQAEKFVATFDIDGRKARLEVRAASVRNPFRLRELEQFECPGQL
ncbi:type VI secretion system membrane subunit TssM [Pseudoduganella namucuonensis]|uniref:Type VI secretion system protein ImpL n=1 Tax=Pseudoduganella namucuonensis TaxID=1035707 RepID=A0A1I7KPE3_9BURK|nr:type VI secretion system membrane subunit TssM [Pseudoduganella namucuonensis]SFU99289.1 type VI secretion system protein ImpL [Pseudoduganella namucuonensis]